MLGLELVVVLGFAVLVSGVAAPRLRLAPPVLQLACGVLLGFVPALRGVHLPPEVMLLVFLPALLWWESLTASLRDIRRNLRGIVLTGSLLVVVTAAAVAAVAHALGMAWGPAWVLGAAVAPTDATAVGVLARVLPHRTTTVLRAESLVNDGTALVLYALAVGVTTGQQRLSAGTTSWLFALSYGGGIATGLVVGWLGDRVRRRMGDPLLENVVFLLTPFTAYLLAEEVGASGVLAVVVAGLLMSQLGPRVGTAEMRAQAQLFWGLATVLLNGALFVLVGLEAQAAVRGLTSVALTQGLVTVAVVAVALVVVRWLFLVVSAHLIRLLDRRPQQRLRRVSERSRVVSAVAGFRGAVSLAVALSVPQTLGSGAPFPQRDLVVFVTAGVIVVTLAVQAPLLPAVVRWARLPADTTVEQERHLADQVATEEALAAVPRLAGELGTDPEVADRLRQELEEHLEVLQLDAAGAGPGGGSGDGGDAQEARLLQQAEDYRELRLAVLGRKRAAVLALRDAGRIDDTVLRPVQARLDVEELRLSRRDLVE